MSGLFREKSMARVSSPEELNDYIRVTTPGVWLILLLGMLVWSIFGMVDVERAYGTVETVNPITFVTN